MVNAHIQVEAPQLRAVREKLSGIAGGARVAVQAALSETLETARSKVNRMLRGEINLRLRDVNKAIEVRKPSLQNLTGNIRVLKESHVWLWDYLSGAQRTSSFHGWKKKITKRKGELHITSKRVPTLMVRVRKKRTLPKWPIAVPRAFVGRMPNSGYEGIFQRIGVKRPMKSGRYAGKVREVIKRMRGPSPLGVFLHAQGEEGGTIMFQETIASMKGTLAKNLEGQISRLLDSPTIGAKTMSLLGKAERFGDV